MLSLKTEQLQSLQDIKIKRNPIVNIATLTKISKMSTLQSFEAHVKLHKSLERLIQFTRFAV